jgi:hypothetical protein
MVAETDAPSSVLAEVMRVAKLDATGATPAAASSMYVTDAIVLFTWAPDVFTGLDLTQRKGNGDLCINKQTADTVRRYTCSLQICSPDPELEQLLQGGVVLTSAGATVGYGAPKLGLDPTPNGVSIEIWSQAWDGAHVAATNPFFWWAFPRIELKRRGSTTLESGITANTFEGFMYENPNWGNGPANDWLSGSDRAYQYQRTATTPTPQVGLQAIPAQA